MRGSPSTYARVSQSVRDRRISEMTTPLRYNFTVETRAAGVALLARSCSSPASLWTPPARRRPAAVGGAPAADRRRPRLHLDTTRPPPSSSRRCAIIRTTRALPRAHATLTCSTCSSSAAWCWSRTTSDRCHKDDVKSRAAPAAATVFQAQVARSIALSEAQLQRRPDIRRRCSSSVRARTPGVLGGDDRRTRDGRLRGRRRAYNLHERVMTVAPQRVDAGLIVGTTATWSPAWCSRRGGSLHGRLRRRQGEGPGPDRGGGQPSEPVAARRPLRAGPPLQPGRALRVRPDAAR